MAIWQIIIVLSTAGMGAYLFLRGFRQCHKHKNAFGDVHTGPLGAYVWGDAVVFGAFWFLVSIFTLLLNDWVLFLLVFSVFWMIRSFGEMIYWLNEQHASQKRVNIKNKWLFKYFHNDSVLFIYQTTHQCLLVISIIASIYFASIWLKQI